MGIITMLQCYNNQLVEWGSFTLRANFSDHSLHTNYTRLFIQKVNMFISVFVFEFHIHINEPASRRKDENRAVRWVSLKFWLYAAFYYQFLHTCLRCQLPLHIRPHFLFFINFYITVLSS